MVPTRLVILFFVLFGAALALNVKFVVDARNEVQSLQQQLPPKDNPRSEGEHASESLMPVAEVSTLAESHRSRLLILLLVFALCFVSLTVLTSLWLVKPLKAVLETAREISYGNLDVSVEKQDNGVVGALADTMNDIAVNYQEVLHLAGTKVGNSLENIEDMEQSLENSNSHPPTEEIQQRLGMVKAELEMVSETLRDFRFYQTRFDGRKVVGEDP